MNLAFSIFGKKEDINAGNTKYTTEGFNELDNLDTDEDGVVDINDNCPGTP